MIVKTVADIRSLIDGLDGSVPVSFFQYRNPTEKNCELFLSRFGLGKVVSESSLVPRDMTELHFEVYNDKILAEDMENLYNEGT
jgi:hypothetical protein